MALRLWGGENVVNTTTADNQLNPVVAALVGGGHVIAWQDDNGAGTAVIRFQRYDANGNPASTEQTVPNADGEGDQVYPAITALADGSFVIGLLDADPTNSDTMAYRFSKTGILDATYALSDNSNSSGSPLLNSLWYKLHIGLRL